MIHVSLPLAKPGYTSTLNTTEADWVAANMEDLRVWYMQVGDKAPEEDRTEFADFCGSEYESAQADDWQDEHNPDDEPSDEVEDDEL